MTNIRKTIQPEELLEIYKNTLQTLTGSANTGDITITFHPYVGVTHRVSARDGEIAVKLSENCRDMEKSGHEALAIILLSKILRRRVPSKAREVYKNAVNTDEMRERALDSRKTRGRKILCGAVGDFYDLSEIFDELNHAFFNADLQKPELTWSRGKTFRRLGHHDPLHNTIVISKSLDQGTVPDFVVKFVMFHEMLHVAIPAKEINGRRYHHTPEFKKAERAFPLYEQAERWISANIENFRQGANKKSFWRFW